MKRIQIRGTATCQGPHGNVTGAFTLVELLVVIALIGILAALLLPAMAKAKAKAQGIACLNNTRQLGYAWTLYASDHDDRLPYNLVENACRTNINWTSGYMNWQLDNSDNTNTATVTHAGLGPYANRSALIFKCPTDFVLSKVQRDAGWNARVRSYSMNAMVGDAGTFSATGVNSNNPGYVQFFKMTSIPEPAQIFVFLDEHPDSIGDGYFLNRAAQRRWQDLPASYHDGAAAFSFADGHAHMKRWLEARTKVPAKALAIAYPFDVAKAQSSDFNWVLDHMSVDRGGVSHQY